MKTNFIYTFRNAINNMMTSCLGVTSTIEVVSSTELPQDFTDWYWRTFAYSYWLRKTTGLPLYTDEERRKAWEKFFGIKQSPT